MVDEKSNGNKLNVEWFRIITPVIVTLNLFMLSSINSRVIDINQKLFHHLTNAELHYPRSIVVTQSEFIEYKRSSYLTMTNMEKNLDRFEKNIKDYISRAVNK